MSEQTPSKKEQEPKSPNDQFSRKLKKTTADYNKYLGLGFQLAGPVVGGFFVGRLIDNYLENKTPWFTLSLSVLMIFVSLYQLIKQSNKR